MAITVGQEVLLTLAQAARRLPRRNNGKAPHVGALYRWASTGCRGVVLETIQFGGQRFTTMAALQRFAEALTQLARPGRASAAATPHRRIEADIERADAEVGRLLGVAGPHGPSEREAIEVRRSGGSGMLKRDHSAD